LNKEILGFLKEGLKEEIVVLKKYLVLALPSVNEVKSVMDDIFLRFTVNMNIILGLNFNLS
jgi:hypothetical protein